MVIEIGEIALLENKEKEFTYWYKNILPVSWKRNKINDFSERNNISFHEMKPEKSSY